MIVLVLLFETNLLIRLDSSEKKKGSARQQRRERVKKEKDRESNSCYCGELKHFTNLKFIGLFLVKWFMLLLNGTNQFIDVVVAVFFRGCCKCKHTVCLTRNPLELSNNARVPKCSIYVHYRILKIRRDEFLVFNLHFSTSKHTF